VPPQPRLLLLLLLLLTLLPLFLSLLARAVPRCPHPQRAHP
jgi:hypothetical protein